MYFYVQLLLLLKEEVAFQIQYPLEMSTTLDCTTKRRNNLKITTSAQSLENNFELFNKIRHTNHKVLLLLT